MKAKIKSKTIFTVTLAMDIIAVIPIDYALLFIGKSSPWTKLIRILKFRRVSLFYERLCHYVESLHLRNIIVMVFANLFFTHIIACGMYALSYYEHLRGGRFDGKDFVFFIFSANILSFQHGKQEQIALTKA